MNGLIFFCCLYGCITVGRALLALMYAQQMKRTGATKIDMTEFTVIQPILSGDPSLSHDLQANLDNSQGLKFIWLVDKADVEAQRVVKHILQKSSDRERVQVNLFDPVPDRLNPKTYKMKLALPTVMTKYCVILDDDTVVAFDTFATLEPVLERQDEWLVTGIPYNAASTTIWSRLVAAFVNSQSFFAYFSMAQVRATDTINGMFYIAKTEMFKKYDAFAAIEEWLCDDLALARYLKTHQVELIQLPLFCNVQTTVTSWWQYVRLMKRWMLFAAIYLKQIQSVWPILLVLLPTLLPLILVVIAVVTGNSWLLGCLLVKACFTYGMRYIIFSRKEPLSVIVCECLSDVMMPLFFGYTLLSGPTIQWRDKKIKVTDGRIEYEDDK